MGQRNGCLCPGHWRYKLSHFVVTRRGVATVDGKEVTSGYSELKCRQCQRKWRSSARYIAKLSDWEERKYKQLTEQMLLDLIRAEHVQVDFKTARVWKESKPFGRWSGVLMELKERLSGLNDSAERGGSPYLFVVICNDGHRREPPVSKVVWMAYHDKLVPDGYQIDHADHDNLNNRPNNLRAVPHVINEADRVDEWIDNGSEVPF